MQYESVREEGTIGVAAFTLLSKLKESEGTVEEGHTWY